MVCAKGHQGGQKTHEQIAQNQKYDKLLLIIFSAQHE